MQIKLPRDSVFIESTPMIKGKAEEKKQAEEMEKE